MAGHNWYRFNLKNVENATKNYKGFKSYREFTFQLAENNAKTHMTSFELFRLLKSKKYLHSYFYNLFF